LSPGARLLALADPAAAGPGAARQVGAKAARLAVALRAGLPVLPGVVIPVNEGRAALGTGAQAVRCEGMQAGRRAVLGHQIGPALIAELQAAVRTLGGRVIVRSSSPLEADPRWSGAFSSVAEVGPGDVATAVRSCWASAFAVDPLERLAACGLPPEALELALLLQPELRPDAGGVARACGDEVTVEGVKGHPAALLSGWADGAQVLVRLARGTPRQAPAGHPVPPSRARLAQGESCPAAPAHAVTGDAGLAAVIGGDLVTEVARLAGLAHRRLGDDLIEWAAANGKVWLLQSQHSAPALAAARPDAAPGRPPERFSSWPPGGASAELLTEPDILPPAGPAQGPGAASKAAGLLTGAGTAPGLAAGRGRLTAREWMPLLAELTQTRGQQVPARPAAPGLAAGRLVVCRPHQRPAAATRDAILLVDRPVPALAPLLFGARGVIARAGAAGSHLAEVARSLSVPMVIGCRPDPVLGEGPPGQEWIAAVDGAAGAVALLPASAISSA
jgi:phosphohistidine swiveling domain-containing protein